MGFLLFRRNMNHVKQGKPFLIMLPKDLCISHTHSSFLSVKEDEGKSVGYFGIFSFMQRVRTNRTDL